MDHALTDLERGIAEDFNEGHTQSLVTMADRFPIDPVGRDHRNQRHKAGVGDEQRDLF